jgi:hypothetical protein
MNTMLGKRNQSQKGMISFIRNVQIGNSIETGRLVFVLGLNEENHRVTSKGYGGPFLGDEGNLELVCADGA